ncbi:MAG: hypothetical protein QM723_15055 [Myxococcaceae bacterium]
MTATSKIPSSSPKTTLPTDVEVGDLSAQISAASVNIADLDGKIARLDAGLKDPNTKGNKREILELKQKYSKLRQTEVNKRDYAQSRIDASFKALEGKGSAKEAATADYSRLTQIDVQIAGTEGQKTGAIQTLTQATSNYEAAVKKYGPLSQQAHIAEQKAVAAERQVEQLESKLASLQRARTVTSNELGVNEQQAFADAKKAGDPTVKDIADFSQLSGTSASTQQAVVGAPVVGVTQQQAVAGEVKRLELAATHGSWKDDSANNVSKLMNEQMKDATPEHQLALVKAASNHLLPEVAALAQKSTYVPGPLLDTLKTAQGEAQVALATEIAKPMTGMDSQVVKELDKRMKNGDGFEEALALEKGLKAAGKPELAQQVAELSRTRLNEITTEFQSKGEEVAAAKGDLARLMAGFGPLIPGDKQQAAVDAFKARHQDAFDAYDAAGTKLAHAAKFVMENSAWNTKALEMMPDALATKGGQIEVNNALKNQAKGVKTFLTAGPEAMKDSSKVAKYLPQVVVKAVGQNALDLARAGKTAEAQKAIEGLKNNAEILGMDAKKVDKLTSSLGKVVNAEKPDDVLKALKGFDEDLRAAKPSAGVASALKSVAWGASIVNGVTRLSNNDDLKSLVKGTAEIVGPTGEMAASTVEMLANSETALFQTLGKSAAMSNVKMLGKGLGGVATGLGAALDAISAVQSFAKGDVMEGSLSSLSAIGGATLAVDTLAAAAGAQVVPVWGQVAGAALVIGGTIGKWAWAEHKANKAEDAMESDAKAYLQAGGISEPVADELKDIKRADGRNAGMMIQQLAQGMGMDPKELFSRISKLPPDKISDFVDMAKDLQLDKDGRIAKESQGRTDVPYHAKKQERYPGQDKGPSQTVAYYPQSQGTAIEWTKKFLKDNGV